MTIQTPNSIQTPIDCQAYLQQAWIATGRPWLEAYTGLNWDAVLRTWGVTPGWTSADGLGQKAYTAAYGAEIGVNISIGQSDDTLLDELASFYVRYMQDRMTTLGQLRAEASSTNVPAGEVNQVSSQKILKNQGPDTTRTIAWYERLTTGKIRVRECVLCNTQFFHPASRLLKAIAVLPAHRRTPFMSTFVQEFTTFLVQDHLLRICFIADTDYWGLKPFPRQRVEAWKAIITATIKPPKSYQHSMMDVDLWLIASASEILGANAIDQALVQISTIETDKLKEIVNVGIDLLKKKTTTYKDTKDFAGQAVGSVSYFNGDYDDNVHMSFARYSGSAYPTETDRFPAVLGSWDISHFHRVPIFVASLYENKEAAGTTFPTVDDVRLLVNHYVYRVFQGDFTRPIFNNFFDGNNGWYRVGYTGSVGFGYPPAGLGSQLVPNRPCLTAGLFGWGRLATLQPDLMKVHQAVIAMAESTDPCTVRFRERYYREYGKSFAYTDAKGQMQYPFLLMRLLSDNDVAFTELHA